MPGVAEEKTILTNKVRRINLSTLALGASTVAEFMNPLGLSPGNNSNRTDKRTHLNHEEEEDELYRNGRVATKIDCGSQLGSALASHDDDRGGQGTSRHPAKNYCVITNRNEEVPIIQWLVCASSSSTLGYTGNRRRRVTIILHFLSDWRRRRGSHDDTRALSSTLRTPRA